MTRNPYVWIAWLFASMLAVIMTYNPAYLAIILISGILVSVFLRIKYLKIIKFSITLSAIPFLVNMFFVHLGKTVLFEIPFRIHIFGIPMPVFFVSGPITLEAIFFGLIMSLLLVDIILVFGIFNLVVGFDSIVRIIPGIFSKSALLASIAMNFIPTLTKDINSITDAQRSRGLNLIGGRLSERIRNHISIITPLLMNSLERSYNLAESMESRAYTGIRTGYKKTHWRKIDVIIVILIIISLSGILYAKISGYLEYWPYESLRIPEISSIAVISLLLLTIPALTSRNEYNS